MQIQYNNNGVFAGTTVTTNGTQLLAPNGSNSAPSYALSAFPNTGFYYDQPNSRWVASINGAPLFFMGIGFQTATNCSSSASPAVCGSAVGGSVVIAAAATTVQVNTTGVTANSQILLTRDDSLGTKLGVTCNTATVMGEMKISARTGGTSFTITVQTAPATNPGCISYLIIN